MAKRFKVVITDFVNDGLEPERQILGGVAEVTALDARSEDDLKGRVEDADAVVMYHYITVGRDTIGRLERCKLIVRSGVGIDNVDHAFAQTRGIPVVNIPDYGTEDVADTAVSMMLALVRGIHVLNSRLRAGLGDWSYAQARPLHRLRGRRLGIVGLGRIGTAVALRAKAFGMHVVFYDPFKPDGYDKALGVQRAETLPDLLRQVDVLTLHCPLTEATHHLIDAHALEQMPAGAYLVNTARGAIVDTVAIPDAVATGRLAGAAFDVLTHEPPIDDPLVRAWQDPRHPAHYRVLINPHSAFYSEEGLLEIRTKGAQACLRVFEGKALRNVVNGP